MGAPFQVLFKNGQWQIDDEQVQKLLDDSASDSGEELPLLEECILPQNEDSDYSEIESDVDEIQPDDIAEAQILNVWHPGIFIENILPSNNEPVNTVTVQTPVEYFRRYFSDQHFIDASTYTNSYHFKTHGVELKTSALELKKLYGALLLIGCVSYPRLDMYWSKGFRVELIANAIPKTRFKKLRAALHYVDVDHAVDPTNSFWKIQPIINTVRDRCRSLSREVGTFSVDEQMIPYTGRCPSRQYVRNKPRPVGLKNFVITKSTGLVIDFELYQGERSNFGDRSLGLGPAVVLRLVETIPKGSFIFFDRYFTTVPLLFELLTMGYRATGTVMSNRLKKISFKTDRSMARGESQEFILNNGTQEITCVKWKDTKCVTAVSTISGTHPTTTVNRWNKQTKSYQSVTCPSLISQYNKNMGGVDIVDQMMEYYRTFIKTKKWTLKVISHMIDLALVNAWMEYREDCAACKIPKKRIKDLLDFKMEVAGALIASVNNKRRDISSEDEDVSVTGQAKLCSPLPCTGKRFDGYDHWPVFDCLGTAKHCRLETCKCRTRCRCEKCQVYLCLSSQRNCFKQFHTLK